MSDSKSLWEAIGGGTLAAGILACIPGILRNKSAKDVEEAKSKTAHEEGEALEAKATVTLTELVQQCMTRLGKLEDRLDEKDEQIKELQELLQAKAERIAALEKVQPCVPDSCPLVGEKAAEIARLTLEIAELQKKITALEVLGEKHAI